MTAEDIKRIFNQENVICFKGWAISVDKFLNFVGFGNCEPTKEAMLAFDGGKLGYAEFIESGNWEAEAEL